MRRCQKDKIRTITRLFYDLLKVGTVITLTMLVSQGRTGPKLLRGFAKYGVWRIRQMLREQKLLGYIEYDEEDEHSPILLTNKGFLRVTKENLRNARGTKWDHLWRLISFDIPEKTGVRKKFVALLRSIGCYRVQKSIYAYPHECKEHILSLASSCRASSYVDVFTVPNLGRHEKHARRFYIQRHLMR